ncbi:hypothetical protein [Streptomyces sp. NBC_00122]|uniref:hypothetical protein n=1 Tax=Streptomyces sp. NBC_00122 TaxID=2903623 RepID=UPI003251A497
MTDINQLVDACRNGATKMRPVLPLGQALSIGSIGFLEDHAFRYLGTVETLLGKNTGTPIPGGGISSFYTTSKDGYYNKIYASGATSETFGQIVGANAAIELTFAGESAFMLSAKNITIHTMADPATLLAEILKRYKTEAWEKRYCLVYQVGVAASYTAVLARQSGAKLLLGADASFGQGDFSVADAAAGARFERQIGALDHVVGAKDIPAFFSAYRVKERFFRSNIVKSASALPPNAPSGIIAQKLEITENPFEEA